MKIKDLSYRNKILRPSKAFINPNFKSKTVLASSHWDYVEMFLKRNSKNKEALFYWRQSKAFYLSAKNLPRESSPLNLYYCFLNASKALLTFKNESFSKHHGVSGKIKPGNTNLKNEIISFKHRGIASALGRYFEDDSLVGDFSMWELLYNLVFIHRSFNLTYPSGTKQLFTPIKNVRYVISNFQHYGWLVFETFPSYQNKYTLNQICNLGFEIDNYFENYTIRYNKKFKWYYQGNKKKNNLNRLSNYQSRTRKHLTYIYGDKTLWYIKREGTRNLVNKHPVVIIFGVMHRLSELARYEPLTLNSHFKQRQNWLLTEFVNGSPEQFIDMISCEITDSNIMNPAIRK